MRVQAATKVCRLADVKRGSYPIAEYVHSGRGWRRSYRAFSHAPPVLVPILEDERLLDERARERGRRSADTKDLSSKTLVIRCLSGHEPSE